MAVRINGTSIPTPARLLQGADGALLATADELARWRIRAPAGAPLVARGRSYLPLAAVEGLAWSIDERTQTLELRASPAAFLPTVLLARSAAYLPPDAASTGAFLNYDLQYQRQGGVSRTDGLFEAGLFNPWGFGTAAFLARDAENARALVRLDTAWTSDRPETLTSLRLGDSISRPGAWGRAVRFGGVQWGTDYSTRPDLVTFPLPTVRGEALVPSTVDLYVDNALRLSRQVPPGPFSIPDVPVITGEGEVRMVVRDALGRERVLVQPYYASGAMLRAGLHDYTYEAGFVRRDFGLDSNAYGDFLAAATHRVGVTDRFTAEAHGEAQASQQAAGVAGTYRWGELGVVNGALAASNRRGERGGLAELGFERQAWPLSFGYHVQVTSADFAQLGLAPERAAPRRTSVARASLATPGGGAFYVNHLRRIGRTEPDVEFVGAGYSIPLFRNAYLSAFALRQLGGEGGLSVGVSLTHALGPRTTASVEWNRQDGDAAPGFRLQRSLPAGPGVGYRVAAADGTLPRREAGFFLRGDVGTYGIEVARTGGADGQRLSASGGVAVLGGGVHFARRLDDSFAVVKVGGYPQVPVYVDNQLMARTDADGTALVPVLRAYQKNDVSIGQESLPLDARVGALHLAVTPGRRSGQVVDFPVRATRGALLRIVLDDGSPMPSGALVHLVGREEVFPVARRGEAYVTGLADDNELEGSWKGQRCTFRARLPRAGGPLPVIGPLLCAGVRP